MTPRLSVIVPVFNRSSLLAHPLASLCEAALAAPCLNWELIIVDDGSSEDIRPVLNRYPQLPARYLRLENNQGLLAARLAGLSAARGDAVCFLDADDAISPEKFSVQLEAHFNAYADVSHGNTARRRISSDGVPVEPLRNDTPSRPCDDVARFYLSVQPAPHTPIFSRDYLQSIVSNPMFPPSRDYDPIAETWFYYQLSVHPAKIFHVPKVVSIVGEPDGERLSRKWERQCAASLRLMRNFVDHCPKTPVGNAALSVVGGCAFATWRALPRGFPPADRLLEIWKACPSVTPPGGPYFSAAARLLGPVAAGRLFKYFLRPTYAATRTVDPSELSRLFA